MSSIAYAVGSVKYLDEQLGTSFFDENVGFWHQKIEERTHGFFPFYKPNDDVIWAKEYLRDTLTTQKVAENKLWARQMIDCVNNFNATNDGA